MGTSILEEGGQQFKDCSILKRNRQKWCILGFLWRSRLFLSRHKGDGYIKWICLNPFFIMYYWALQGFILPFLFLVPHFLLDTLHVHLCGFWVCFIFYCHQLFELLDRFYPICWIKTKEVFSFLFFSLIYLVSILLLLLLLAIALNFACSVLIM